MRSALRARALARVPWAAAVVLAGSTPALAGQNVRGWATTGVQYAGLRPLRADTVPLDRVVERSPGSFEVDGERVECIPAIGCLRWIAAPVESATLATQDLALTGWGFGVQGLSATLVARSRAQLGGGFAWPRGDDAFDLSLAYAELDRGAVRARLGRQESLGGLGFAGYDGLEVHAVLPRGVRLEGYGGRSLARGLREPRDAALRGLQDFLPERGAWLLGGALAYLGPASTSAELRYQREIWSDRRGLISERAALDVRTARLAPVTVAASLDWDFASARAGKGQLQLRRPLFTRAGSSAAVELTGRRYLPYFELHTIWGVFSPVAYHEVELRGSWAGRTATAWGAGAYRAYEDARAPAFLESPSSRGWRASAGAVWTPKPAWSAQAAVATEIIPGALLSSADVSIRLEPHPRLVLSATATGFQQIEEFRLGDGRVLGAALAAESVLGERLRLDLGAGAYRHRDAGRSDAYDWSQLRAWSSLRVEIGSDPGLVRAGAP